MTRRYVLLLICGLVLASPSAAQILAPGYVISDFYVAPAGANCTSLSQDDFGRVYLLQFDGKIRVLEDLDGDRIAETETLAWAGTGINQPALGLLWFQGRLYVNHAGTVSMIEDLNGDLVGDVKTDLVTGLPFGLHQNDDLFSDGQWIYFGIGSTTDHGVEPDPRSATLMRMLPDGSQVGVVARGLRNAFDGVVHPTSGQIIVSDNGPNAVPGLPYPPDELNIIEPGNDYGHPLYWGTPPPGTGTIRPILDLPAHAAPTGIAVDPGKALSGYVDQIFLLAFSNGSGGAIFRIPLFYGPASGTPLAWYEFFAANLDYPIDCAFSSRGELYVLEYLSGRVRLIRPAHDAAVRIEDQPTLGTVCHMTFRASGHGGHVYLAAASTSVGPAIPLAPGVDLLLDILSPVFALSLQPNPFFYFGSPGVLDGQGEALAAVVIPPQAFLIGAGVEIQFVVLDPQSLIPVAASPPQRMTFLPVF